MIKRFWFFSLIVLQGVLCSGDGNYAIAIGETDRERLIILNEIYNPGTEAFLKSLPIKEGSKVLDIGCGIGLVSQKIASLVGATGSVLACDLHEEQLEIAKSLLPPKGIENLQFRKLSAYQIASLKEEFDVVYIRLLLVHLPNPERVIAEAKKILKPGGHLIIEDFTSNASMYSTPRCRGMEILQYLDQLQFEVQGSDDTYFSRLPALLEQEGFQVIKTQKNHPRLNSSRQRRELTLHLPVLKESLKIAGKITEEESMEMIPFLEQLEADLSIEVFSYEMGQIHAQSIL